jgi:hypothetical protein
VAVGLVLFPLLPRLRTGALLSLGPGAQTGVSGFSDRVALGDLGRIRFDPRVALRVETLEGEAPPADERYLRGLAFDHFDGRRWSVTPPGRTPVGGDAERGVRLGLDPGPRRSGARLVQRVAREPMETGVLFGAGRFLEVEGRLGRLERDAGGGLHAYQTAGGRVDYVATTRLVAPSDADLARERAVPPPEDGGRHLALPPLGPAVEALARRITAGAASDAARARALERWLRREGRYSDRPPVVPPDDPRSPVEVFLEGGLAGHCEYFASAMALLARSVGLPARIVNGFAGGTENRVGGFVELTRSDAHTWVEIHYDGSGWVPYDPTPPDLRLAGAMALREDGSIAAWLSAAELWWFRNVVDFDRGHQLRALRSLWSRMRALRTGGAPPVPGDAGHAPGTPEGRAPVWRAPLRVLLLVGLGLGLALLVRTRRSPRARVHADYAAGLRLLARRGLVRAPASTARAFAAQARRRLPRTAARAFDELTEVYLHERFGRAPAGRGHEALAALRHALHGAQRARGGRS